MNTDLGFHVIFDVNVFLDPVRGCKAAPTMESVTPRHIPGNVLTLARLNPAVRLHFGDHIANQIVRVLTRDYGWSNTEAQKWADSCRALAASTGGVTDIAIIRDRNAFARYYGMWQVPDREDCQVINITQQARRLRGFQSAILVTSDKDLQHARVPGLRSVSPTQLFADLAAARTAAQNHQAIAA